MLVYISWYISWARYSCRSLGMPILLQRENPECFHPLPVEQKLAGQIYFMKRSHTVTIEL